MTSVVEEAVSPDSIATMLQRIEELEKKHKCGADSNSLSMLVFSGELDKLLAAFIIATGAAACGMRVSMFFSFSGAAALKKDGPQTKGKSTVERMFGTLLPGGLSKRKLSKLDMLGMGRRLMAREMAKKNVASLPELIKIASELEVDVNICEMSMSLMGIQAEELIDYPGMEFSGVASFIEQSSSSNTTMFI